MDWMQLSWKLLIARGVVGIIFGIVAMVWPVSTAVVLVALWGVWALIDGVGAFVGVFAADGFGTKMLFLLLGIVAVAAAFVAFSRPGMTAVTLTWFLGIWLVVRGVIDLGAMIIGKGQGPVVLGVLASGLSIVAGVIFAANPGKSAVALAFWLGVLALLWGVVFVVTGLTVRRNQQEMESASAA